MAVEISGLPGFIDPRSSNLVPDASGLAGALSQMLGRKREEKKQAEAAKAKKLQQDFKTTGAQMLRIRDIKDFTSQRKEIAILGQQAVARGEDPTLFTDALNVNNPDELNLFLTRTATAAGNADKLIADGLKADGKQFEPVVENGQIVAQRDTDTGKVLDDPRAGQRSAVDEKKVVDDLKATKDQFDRSFKLRGEIAKLSTDFNKQRGAWDRVQASAVDPSPAGDLALIFNFMKVLDPGSTVREGEFAQVGAAGSLPTQIQRMYDQYATGQKLTPSQRKDVTDRAKKLFVAAEKTNKEDVNKIVSIGKAFGLDKDLLLGGSTPVNDLTPDEQTELDALRARFNNGNP